MQSELANGIEYAFPAREKYSGIFWQNAEGPGKWASRKNFLENREITGRTLVLKIQLKPFA